MSERSDKLQRMVDAVNAEAMTEELSKKLVPIDPFNPLAGACIVLCTGDIAATLEGGAFLLIAGVYDNYVLKGRWDLVDMFLHGVQLGAMHVELLRAERKQ